MREPAVRELAARALAARELAARELYASEPDTRDTPVHLLNLKQDEQWNYYYAFL